jgi:hypothetical protein
MRLAVAMQRSVLLGRLMPSHRVGVSTSLLGASIRRVRRPSDGSCPGEGLRPAIPHDRVIGSSQRPSISHGNPAGSVGGSTPERLPTIPAYGPFPGAKFPSSLSISQLPLDLVRWNDQS